MRSDRAWWLASWLIWSLGCGFPRPEPVGVDDGGTADSPGGVCAASQALRCDGSALVVCNDSGTAEVTKQCAVGCDAVNIRCRDIAPSNGLGVYLDMAASQPDVDLGAMAVVNTDDGSVTVAGNPIVVKNATLAQVSAPGIRVFIVRRLTAMNVKVVGARAIALVSDGEIHIGGTFSVSASTNEPGPGRFNDAACKGGDSILASQAFSGTGGGGFGSPGGAGGTATNAFGSRVGGTAGAATGDPALSPLRGGCDSGTYEGTVFGAGAGAVQLVSRSAITLAGVVAANGSSYAGGGSGGGVLIEAPIVDVSGGVVANGGAGAGGCPSPNAGEAGRMDAKPAAGGPGCAANNGVAGGQGAARDGISGKGGDVALATNTSVFGGHGGGGVGRIRINTAVGGLHATGTFSPNPSTGVIATR